MSGYHGGKAYQGLFRDRSARFDFWMTVLGYLVLAFFVAIPVLSFWKPGNRSKKVTGTPSMQSEQYGQKDYREERPVTILIAPIRNNKNDRIASGAEEHIENKTACFCFDDPIELRVSSGDSYQIMENRYERK